MLKKENAEDLLEDDFVLDNSIKMYFNEIGQFSTLSQEETSKLIKEYHSTLDKNIKNKILEGHLKLVINIARKYVNLASSYTFLDLIQEGNIGMVKSIESYDSEISAFSTYASRLIEQTILRAIRDKDSTISKPQKIVYLTKKYQELNDEYYHKYSTYPSDEYVRKELSITNNTLYWLKNQENFNVASLDKKIISDDETSSNQYDLVASKENFIDKLLDNIADFDLMCILKNNLEPKFYYVLYCHIFSDEPKKLEDIGQEFAVTRERIRQMEKTSLEKIKNMIIKDSQYYKICSNKIKNEEGKNYNRLRVEPIYPRDICLFLFLKNSLNELEQKLLYYKLLSKYNFTISEIADIIGVPIEEILIVKQSLDNKISAIDNNEFKSYQHNLLSTLHFKIFDEELNLVNNFNYKKLNSHYSKLTYQQLENLCFENNINLTIEEQNILLKYYNKTIETSDELQQLYNLLFKIDRLLGLESNPIYIHKLINN